MYVLMYDSNYRLRIPYRCKEGDLTDLKILGNLREDVQSLKRPTNCQIAAYFRTAKNGALVDLILKMDPVSGKRDDSREASKGLGIGVHGSKINFSRTLRASPTTFQNEIYAIDHFFRKSAGYS